MACASEARSFGSEALRSVATAASNSEAVAPICWFQALPLAFS